MKPGLLLTIVLFLIGCNEPGGRNSISDSLGNKIIDTPRRYDTMNYERMQTKTGIDSTSQSPQRRNDTANYERMPQRRDSSHNP